MKAEKQVQKNTDAYGNAWFVSKVQWVNSADEAMHALDSISKQKAVLNSSYKALVQKSRFEIDSTSQIRLTNYKANKITYTSYTDTDALAVFSEMYYPQGWKAFIDNKPASIIRANYVLRALYIPKGKHTIVFEFNPEVVKKGAFYSLMGYLLLLILGVAFWFFSYKKGRSA